MNIGLVRIRDSSNIGEKDVINMVKKLKINNAVASK